MPSSDVTPELCKYWSQGMTDAGNLHWSSRSINNPLKISSWFRDAILWAQLYLAREKHVCGVQAQLLTSAAMKAGFSGGLVVDYPNSTRAKKQFLVLMVGTSTSLPSPEGLDGGSEEEAEEVHVSARRQHNKRSKTGQLESVPSSLT